MSRLVALLFALLLPLQFAWGAAASYCQHEPAREVSQHFGHHEHVHKAGAATDGKKSADTKLAADNDCTACHAAGSAAPSESAAGMEPSVATRRMTFPSAPSLSSALARAPDRPQWLRLA
jgi:hypothetical protein